MHHAIGVLCPVTFAMHLARAVETKREDALNRPCVVVAGGRESTHWEAYPSHRYLSLVGALDCCENGGCWRSRTFELGDGDEKDNSLCLHPVDIKKKIKPPNSKKQLKLKIPKCMDMITHKHVIQAIESYYEGGVISYGKGFNAVEEKLRKENLSEDATVEV